MMRSIRRVLLAAFPIAICSAVASATPIVFQLDSVTAVGALIPSTQSYNPSLPIIGSGDIDFVLGTGLVSLPNYYFIINVGPNATLDARVNVNNWSQTITSIDASGNVTSTGGGSVSCTVLGGFGGFICPSISPSVAGWPPSSGSAVLDSAARTITVIDTSNATAGTITQMYSYQIVPEPGTALLMGAGLAFFGFVSRSRGAGR